MAESSSSAYHYDVIVLGVGSMGSAACWFLSRRGKKVLALEQFDIPHDNGSHAGQSRIIRKAYYEHPDYVPLLNRAYQHWRNFEWETGSTFFHQTGVVYLGEGGNENIAGIRRSASLHHVAIENLTREAGKARFPAFEIPAGFDVIFEPDAGFVTPEDTIRKYVREAVDNGAVIMRHTRVMSWKQEGSRIRVVTSAGEYTGDQLVITAGAWTSKMIPGLKIPLTVTRQLLAWISPPDPEKFSLGNFPCWLVEDPALGTFYGFPLWHPKGAFGHIGLKLAHHYPGIPCEPEDIHREFPAAEEEKLKRFLRTYLPGAGEKIAGVKSCLYTYSPDTHFIIDHLPGYEGRVTIACGFSGHGFKFVPAVGEALADLAVKGKTDLPIRFLRIGRLTADTNRPPHQ